MKTRTLLACMLAAAFVPVAAYADAPAQHASDATSAKIAAILKTLGKTTQFGGVSVSPDGKTLAWTFHDKDGDHLQLADAKGRHVRSVKVTGADKGCSDIARPLWSPDGGRVAFLGNCGNDKHPDQADIFVADAASSAPTAHAVTKLDGYAHELSWAPNGKQFGLLYVAGDRHRVGATAATKARVGVIGVSNISHQQFNVVGMDGVPHAITPKSLFVYEYSWSPKSDAVAFVAAPPPGENNWWVAKLYAQDTASGSAPRVVVDPGTVKGSLHGLQIALPRWSPDASRIAFIGGLMSDQGATGGDLYVAPSKGGAPVDVTPGIHTSPSWLTWTGNDRLLVAAIASGKTRIFSFTLDGDKAAHEQPLLTDDSGLGDGSVASAVAVAANHTRFAFIRSTFAHAPEIYSGRFATDRDGQPTRVAQAPRAVTHVNDGLKPLWGKAVSVEWTNEGFHVQGWLLLPANYDPHKTYPMIVNVHGGPVWNVRSGWGGNGLYSALGYFVLMPNPRGSLGEGAAYTQAVRKDMGYGDLRDILAGVDKVEKLYPVDDKRLGISGWSYGGFMSMFAPTQTHRFRAAVAGAGLSNWQSYYGQNMIDQWMLPFFGKSVYDDPAVYAKSSAINFIKQNKTPTLVVVGERDAECPAPQSFEFWHALRAMGVPTQLVVYAGEGHGFHKKEDRIDVLKRSAHWFAKYLGDGADK
ncbi:alpha/beta hydrolase family protein [Oleiagrimonas soli]|uniref:Dipeptidyl aminopeptidase/acylaminoacyl peptidase n=1 Tax=Oleiagrimonas soli TaxID=1543381 RepID=A0A099CYB1_9GAMM|nr:S9 family peptidase [Oleiagrimonas soli]KGI78973.1 peptidase S9 [Oleiagrimonas soli]MBB6184508.1 dipeptidyl aminopeptidase/acylaminoacyl peptidase [Oleiagrimonas soli]